MIGSSRLLFTVFSFGILANLIHLLGLANYIKPYRILPIFFLLIAITIKNAIFDHLNTITNLKKPEKLLLFIVIAQFTINAQGLFIPETSFDALWYHLPEAQVYTSTGSIRPIPPLAQFASVLAAFCDRPLLSC